MFEHLPNLLAPKFFVLYAFIASAVYVHYRGAVRHRFYRQITDHSTIMRTEPRLATRRLAADSRGG